jgi:hypothetical protein
MIGKRFSFNKFSSILIGLLLLVSFLLGCGSQDIERSTAFSASSIANEMMGEENGISIVYGEKYFLMEDVAMYLYLYVELPPNYITKEKARELGWIQSEGNLWEVTDGLIIGGDNFGNREKLLPEKKGRIYFECDVNYEGGYRGAERIVYSNDGLIFYTADHYENFVEIVFEEDMK